MVDVCLLQDHGDKIDHCTDPKSLTLLTGGSRFGNDDVLEDKYQDAFTLVQVVVMSGEWRS